MMLCSFVIPVFNEAESLNELYRQVVQNALLSKWCNEPIKYEIILLMMALVMIRLKSYINYMIMTTMFTLSHSEKILENQQHSKLDSEMSVVV